MDWLRVKDSQKLLNNLTDFVLVRLYLFSFVEASRSLTSFQTMATVPAAASAACGLILPENTPDNLSWSLLNTAILFPVQSPNISELRSRVVHPRSYVA